MELLMHEAGVLSDEQTDVAREGIRATNSTVPQVPPEDRKRAIWFWVMHEGLPIGLVTLIPNDKMEGVAEVGVRFWRPNPRNAFAMSDWMDEVLEMYGVIVVRCYARNRVVKRLLQRAGFRLNRILDGGIEVHSVTRDTFLGRRRAPRGDV